MAEWGARGGRRAIGSTETSAGRAPIRLILLAVAVLAVVSILSFPSVGAAQSAPPPPAGLRAAVLTADGTDGYVLRDEPDRITAASVPGNTGENLRALFWPAAAPVETDATSCATWSDASSDVVQQGAALRITPTTGGAIRALTVTKNVYLHTYWGFNVHVWDTAIGRVEEIASFDLSSAFRFSDDVYVARPLPWRLCARTRAGRLEFKVWRLAESEPAWGDREHGGSVRLPADAPTAGATGWFIGHLRPDMHATFTDLREHPRAAPVTAADPSVTQDLALTAGG